MIVQSSGSVYGGTISCCPWCAVKKLEAARQVMRDYVTVNGVEHDDPDCPEDDTCECPTIANWNAVLR
jgi:hypothetical protein